jgi:hypothetical protein
MKLKIKATRYILVIAAIAFLACKPSVEGPIVERILLLLKVLILVGSLKWNPRG